MQSSPCSPAIARAEAAIRKLAEGGLDIKYFSIVGKGYHSEEKVVGFYNIGGSAGRG